MGMNDINSLSHTKWNCKYHIRAASNNPYAVGGPYSRVYAFARNKGLCPHLKYHAFHAWMFITFPI